MLTFFLFQFGMRKEKKKNFNIFANKMKLQTGKRGEKNVLKHRYFTKNMAESKSKMNSVTESYFK